MGTPISMAEACRRSGVSSHTLRYYESAGLMKNVARAASGRRVYSETDLQWLEVLKVLRGTGMSIRGIRRLAAMVERGENSLEERIAFFREWQAELARQIEFRRQAAKTLKRKIARHEALLEQRRTGHRSAIPCVTGP